MQQMNSSFSCLLAKKDFTPNQSRFLTFLLFTHDRNLAGGKIRFPQKELKNKDHEKIQYIFLCPLNTLPALDS